MINYWFSLRSKPPSSYYSCDVLIFNVLYYFRFQLVVTAYDSGSPGKTATATLTIDVTKNPSIPQFDLTEYSTTIWEDKAPGSNIFNITAVDADSVGFHLYTQIGFHAVDYEIWTRLDFQDTCIVNFKQDKSFASAVHSLVIDLDSRKEFKSQMFSSLLYHRIKKILINDTRCTGPIKKYL